MILQLINKLTDKTRRGLSGAVIWQRCGDNAVIKENILKQPSTNRKGTVEVFSSIFFYSKAIKPWCQKIHPTLHYGRICRMENNIRPWRETTFNPYVLHKGNTLSFKINLHLKKRCINNIFFLIHGVKILVILFCRLIQYSHY